MIEYLNYKKRKLPFSLTMSSVIEFKKTYGKDFEIIQTDGDFTKMYESLLLLTILGLNKGFELSEKSWLKILYNLITTGTKIGIKNKEYVKILDAEVNTIISLLHKFFYMLTPEDKKK